MNGTWSKKCVHEWGGGVRGGGSKSNNRISPKGHCLRVFIPNLQHFKAVTHLILSVLCSDCFWTLRKWSARILLQHIYFTNTAKPSLPTTQQNNFLKIQGKPPNISNTKQPLNPPQVICLQVQSQWETKVKFYWERTAAGWGWWPE